VTKTEDRLTDALHAAAASRVRADRLRPLTAPAGPRFPRARLLAPAGAAAGVALAVALAFGLSSLGGTALGRHPGHHGAKHPPATLGWVPSVPPASAGPPRHYAELSGTQILVRDTATGRVTATVPGPRQLDPAGVAAGPDGEYIAAYDVGELAPESWRQTKLYSFRLTGAGAVAGLSPVRGGVLTGLTVGGFTPAGAIAISPDGAEVALAAYSTFGRSTGKASTPEVARIVVINLRTGARESWQGGLRRAGYGFSIPSISWAPGGHWLVFLGSWCQSQAEDGFCAPGGHLAQVRTLHLAARGGALSHGSALLSESASYPFLVQALLTPGGGSITAAVLPGPSYSTAVQDRQDLRVVQVPLPGGRPVLLYRGQLGDRTGVALACDPSGRYWILAGHANGWFRRGTLHILRPPGGYAVADAW
jgi:hypothetical protein